MKHLKTFESPEFGNTPNNSTSRLLRLKGDVNDEWIESLADNFENKNFEKAKTNLNNIKKNDKMDELLYYVRSELRNKKLEKWIQNN